MARLIDVDKFIKEVSRDRAYECYTHCWSADDVLERLDSSYVEPVDVITMEQMNKYVNEINQILEEEKDDIIWCAGLRYSKRVLEKYIKEKT